MKLAKEVNQHFIAEVRDYHEFTDIQLHLNFIGLKYQFQEIDRGTGQYVAVFWLRDMPKPKGI